MTWLPLTSAQRGLFFAHHLAPTNPCYTTAEVVEFSAGQVDSLVLAAAVQAAHREFEQVRTRYRVGESGPEQQVLDVVVDVPVLDLSSEVAAEAWMRSELDRPMDLAAGDVVRSAVLRLPEGRTWWFHAAHHVVLDGYGIQQLLRRVAEHHDAALGRAPLPELPSVSLADLVAAEAGDEHARRLDLDWWAERLTAMSGTASLAARVAAPAARAIKCSLVLDEATVTAIATGARAAKVAWSDLAVAGIGTYLARVQAQDEVRVGLPQMNRSRAGVGVLPAGLTVCTAMNVLPVTVPAQGAATWAEVVAGTAREQAEVREHPLARQEELARILDRSNGAQLFGAQVNLVPFDLEVALGGVPGLVRNLTAGPVEDMTVCLRGTPRRGRTVRLEIDANPDLYDPVDVERHLARLATYLAAWAGADPATPLADIALADTIDLAALAGFNQTAHPQSPATLAERFLAQAQRTPDATALVFADEQRTYAQLQGAASDLARRLSQAGVGAGDVVGVSLLRGLALYEAVHAVALIGAVYLPLDPDLPAERVAMILEDAVVRIVIEESSRTGVVDFGDVPTIDLSSTEPSSASAPQTELSPTPTDVDAPAYLLFTSGSTGRPKGVLVGHRAIDNRLAWMQHQCALLPGERVLHKTPISFDVSVWELYWPLQVGACVVIAAPGEHRDPRAIARLIYEHQVSTLHFVPSMLRAFLADTTSALAVREAGVRTLVTSGEALTPDLVRGGVEAFGVAPLNLYGPTEAAVDVTFWQCTGAEAEVPIGRPVWNTTCHVLDGAMRPVPVGVPGELWLGGVQLAHGYIGRDDLTAERFVPDPFGAPGERLYRTGDLAAWRPDGALSYLGRTDDQVKVRGQRLELGEVEAALAGTDGAVSVTAGVLADQLVVWFQPAEGREIKDVALALSLAACRQLPSSMAPSHWIPVTQLPLGASGKTDRRALAATYPVSVTSAEETAEVAAAPADLDEQQVRELFAEVLEHGQVGPDDDFFALGGDSLSVLRLVSAIERDLGVRLELADVFEGPTVRGVLDRLNAGEGRASDSALREVLTLRSGTPRSDGSRRAPLVLLPPAGGLGWCYLSLLRHLPDDLPVLTVQAPGIEAGSPAVDADLTALGRRQLDAIRGVVGHEPFHVAGWSLGGMAAHTVAALARSEGQQVGAVVALDAYPSDQWMHLAEPTEAEALVAILRLAGAEDALPEGVEVTRENVLDALAASGSALASLPTPVLQGCLRSVVASARIVRTSTHPVLVGDFDVVVASAPRPESWLDATGWKAHTEGGVREHRIEATHGELVREPYVSQVGKVLGELMEECE